MSVEIIIRSPSDEGEWESGTHTGAANNMALVCQNNTQQLIDDTQALFKLWDAYMTNWAYTTKIFTRNAAEKTSLAFLMEYGSELTQAVIAESNDEPPDDEALRDWFCWLHRHMKYLKQYP